MTILEFITDLEAQLPESYTTFPEHSPKINYVNGYNTYRQSVLDILAAKKKELLIPKK